MKGDFGHILDILSAVSGIIAFVWVGLRADIKSLAEAGAGVRAAPRQLSAYGRLLFVAGPYVLFSIFVVAVIFFALQKPVVTIRHNEIQTVESTVGATTRTIKVGTDLEITSDQPHFEITITGSIYGPEVRSIQDYFGKNHPVRVFAVVSEESAHENKRDLAWVQYNEAGTLDYDRAGTYVVKAYLGGTGLHSARTGERFEVRIYIPEVESGLSAIPYETWDELPKALFLSEPIYIECQRPAS
jgi:hypothetical protein